MPHLKRKKLYFDFYLTGPGNTFASAGGTAALGWRVNVFTCTDVPTAFAALATGGDRYNAVMDALPALTGGSPPEIRRSREVSAWAQMAYFSVPAGAPVGNIHATANAQALQNPGPLCVDFVSPYTSDVRLPFFTAGGGGLTPVVGKEGRTPIFRQHFAVRVRAPYAPSGCVTLRGSVYLQRQHSIEV